MVVFGSQGWPQAIGNFPSCLSLSSPRITATVSNVKFFPQQDPRGQRKELHGLGQIVPPLDAQFPRLLGQTLIGAESRVVVGGSP